MLGELHSQRKSGPISASKRGILTSGVEVADVFEQRARPVTKVIDNIMSQDGAVRGDQSTGRGSAGMDAM